jgi:threonine 3-dehydrogenase
MTDTMMAARFSGKGQISLEERPIPRPGPHQLLVRVDSCALCGTDRGAFENGSDVTPGHEISGTVAAVGEGVENSLIGAPGVVYLVDFCGRCACCRIGRTNMCLNKHAMYGFTADGGYAEFVAVTAKCYLPTPPDLSLDNATALLDLLGTSGHAFRRVGREARSVAVIGCGPIGIGAIAVAVALRAETIVAIDISPYRLELAERLGAATVNAHNGDSVRTCLERLPSGFDVVIEAAGTTSTQQQAISLVSAGGTVAFVAHNHAPLPVDTLGQLIKYEKTLLGSEYFPIGEFHDNLSLVQSGLIPTDELLTHRFSLAEIDDAFTVFMSRRSGKVLVRP